MAFMTGQRTVPNEPVNHIKVTQAVQAMAMPLVFGTMRVSGILIWAGDLSASQHTQPPKKSPGGFGIKANPTYTYTASWVSILASGPILGVNAIWDQSGQYVPQTLQTLFIIPVDGSGPPPNPQWQAPHGVSYV